MLANCGVEQPSAAGFMAVCERVCGCAKLCNARASGKVYAAYARVKVYLTRAVNHLLKNTSEYSRGFEKGADTLSVPSRVKHVLTGTSRERQGNALISGRRNGSADLTRTAGRTTVY